MACENNSVYLLFPTLATNNFYGFDEKTKEWSRLTDFPGKTRSGSIIVSNSVNIYTGLGIGTSEEMSIYDDIWEYDIEENTWVKFCQYPGVPFHSGFAFALNNDLFFGGGSNKYVISNQSLNNEVYRLRKE